MIGETRLGHGDLAHDYYSRINPSAREEISDLHRCEPYVYAQMIAGKDAPTFGEAKNSWLTGTAAWNYYAIAQWILGIRTIARRAGNCSGDPEELAGLHCHPHLSRSDVQNLHRAQGRGQLDSSNRRRSADRRKRRASSRRLPQRSHGQGYSELAHWRWVPHPRRVLVFRLRWDTSP